MGSAAAHRLHLTSLSVSALTSRDMHSKKSCWVCSLATRTALPLASRFRVLSESAALGRRNLGRA